MKRLFEIFLLAGCLAGCNNPAHEAEAVKTVASAEVSVMPSAHHVSLGSVSVEIPLQWNVHEQDETSISYVNHTENNLILLTKENCDNTYNFCMTKMLDDITNSGVSVLKTSHVTINSLDMIEVESLHEDIQLHSWLYYYRESSYVLSCGGFEKNAEENSTLCNEIMYSFHAK